MDSHMFDGLVTGLLVIGAVIGGTLVGLVLLFCHYVLPHIHWS